MFFDTDTADSPWTVIKSDCKEARTAERHALRAEQAALFEQNPDTIGKIDSLIVGRAHVVYERGEKTSPAVPTND